MKLEIVKEFGPIDLVLNKTFGCSEMPEVFIIDDYFDKVFCFLKFWLLFFECFDNHQELFIINFIIVFGWDMFGRKEGDKVESLFQIILRKYTFQNPI